MAMFYVVIGATGQTGSAVIEYLLSQSVLVSVVIHPENKVQAFRSRNVDMTVADLTDTENLIKTFQGAKSVFAMYPPAYNDPNIQAAAATISAV